MLLVKGADLSVERLSLDSHVSVERRGRETTFKMLGYIGSTFSLGENSAVEPQPIAVDVIVSTAVKSAVSKLDKVAIV